MTTGAARTARERVRTELTREIADVARSHLAEQGSAGLSLRAIARELGMVSSAIYRYFPSRDDLLTALIIDAYNAVSEAAEKAERAVHRDDAAGRFLAMAHAIRHWAVAHPQEYALIFGTPVPGYKAPRDTVDPAARIPLLILRTVADARTQRSPDASIGSPPPAGPEAQVIPPSLASDLKALREQLGGVGGGADGGADGGVEPLDALDDTTLARGIAAWTMLIGTISFELFGHLHNVIHDYEGHFDLQMRAVAADLSLSHVVAEQE